MDKMPTAVVMTAYTWDPFVERQFDRLKKMSAGSDLYVLFDATGGRPVPNRPEILSTTESEISAYLGIKLHRETGWGHGTPLWWNLDCLASFFLKQNRTSRPAFFWTMMQE